MLILTRKVGQTITINEGQIKVKILGYDRGQISIGIEAPREINIAREEIYKNIEERLNQND